MTPVAKALWYIERHFAEDLALDDIATAARVSRFHMARAFALATGWPVMRYARARRLTEAARALASGAPNILMVALDAGYGSHEAFTRAFRDQFGVTPEAVRLRGDLETLVVLEPITMNEIPLNILEEPRIEARGPLLMAGLCARYTPDTISGVPAQWQRFAPYLGAIPARTGGAWYGVCRAFDDAGGFDYVCAVEVSRVTDLSQDLISVPIPAARYLVFRHPGHVAGIGITWRAIMDNWLPASTHRPADAPMFERYGDAFDPATGLGGVEIWVPVRA